jgi:chromosomal replication initiation ATPase DnaA
VERLKGEEWKAFRDKHADWGRDLVLWCARRHTGLTLMELGEKVGGLDYTGVSRAMMRLENRARTNSSLRRTMKQLDAICQK